MGRLTWQEILGVRAAYDRGEYVEAIAAEYGVSVATLARAVAGQGRYAGLGPCSTWPRRDRSQVNRDPRPERRVTTAGQDRRISTLLAVAYDLAKVGRATGVGRWIVKRRWREAIDNGNVQHATSGHLGEIAVRRNKDPDGWAVSTLARPHAVTRIATGAVLLFDVTFRHDVCVPGSTRVCSWAVGDGYVVFGSTEELSGLGEALGGTELFFAGPEGEPKLGSFRSADGQARTTAPWAWFGPSGNRRLFVG